MDPKLKNQFQTRIVSPIFGRRRVQTIGGEACRGLFKFVIVVRVNCIYIAFNEGERILILPLLAGSGLMP